MKTVVSLRSCCPPTDFQVLFPLSDATIRQALLAAGVRYEAGPGCYLLPATATAVAQVAGACQQLDIAFHAPAVPRACDSPPAEDLLARYCQHIVGKGYCTGTLNNYRVAFRLFLTHHAPRLPLDLSREEIISYLASRVAEGISETYQNLLVNAIKFYYEQVEGQPWQCYLLPRPKRPVLNPKVLAKEEVKALLQSTENLKHRAMLMLAYGLGLCLREVLSLTIADLDTRRKELCVHKGNPKKGRHMPLPEPLLLLLRQQCQQCRPVYFLFEGQCAGAPYSARSLQQVVQQAAARAGISRPITLHMLRHSYATHSVEAGTDIRIIQYMLGHSNSKTTGIYAHAAQRARPVSPLDALNL